MRRLITPILCLSSFALMACEDGPNQVYQPLPAGAGGIINNGGTDASADPGSAKFDASFGGTSASEICNGPQKHLAWSKAFELVA